MKRLLVIIPLLAAVACGQPSVKEGHVVGRSYDDPDTWTYMQPVYTQQCTSSYNSYTKMNQTSCQSVVSYYLPIEEHDGPHWYLRLRDCKIDDNGNQKCREGDVEVTQQRYDTIKNGVYYKAGQ